MLVGLNSTQEWLAVSWVFFDGAGTYKRNQNQSTTLVLFHVSCFGDEHALFDCSYTTTSTEVCTDPVYIQCECRECFEFLLQIPQQKDAMTQSAASFEWQLKHNVTAFELIFLSQKNPQTLLYVQEGQIVEEHTRFMHRIQLINVDYKTVGFNLTNITAADMGIYSLFVPNRLLTSKAVLIVTDFAVVPDPVIHRRINDIILLSWDLTALRRFRDIICEIRLTTPATGRLHLDYYNAYSLRDNPHRHSVPQPTDKLRPTIVIDKLTAKDAGNYGVAVTVSSSVYQWLNFSWQFTTDLVVDDRPTDTDSDSKVTVSDSNVPQSDSKVPITAITLGITVSNSEVTVSNNSVPRYDSNVPIVAITLGISLGLALISNIALMCLICVYRKRMQRKRESINRLQDQLRARPVRMPRNAQPMEMRDQGRHNVPEPWNGDDIDIDIADDYANGH